MWPDFGEFSGFLQGINTIQTQQRGPRERRRASVRLPSFPRGPPDPCCTLQTHWVSYLGCRLPSFTEKEPVCGRKLNPGSQRVTCISANTEWEDGQPRGAGLLLTQMSNGTPHGNTAVRSLRAGGGGVRSPNTVVTSFREEEQVLRTSDHNDRL